MRMAAGPAGTSGPGVASVVALRPCCPLAMRESPGWSGRAPAAGAGAASACHGGWAGAVGTCGQSLRPPRRAGGCEVGPEGPGASVAQSCAEAGAGGGELSVPSRAECPRASCAPGLRAAKPNQRCPKCSWLCCEDSPCKWLPVLSAVSGFFLYPFV